MHVMIRLLFFFLCINPLFDFASIKPKSHFSKVKAKGKKGKKLKKRYKKKAAKQGAVILSQAKAQIVNALKSINSNNISEVGKKIKAVIIEEINAFFDVLFSTYINKKDNESDTFYDYTFNRAIDRILTDNKISFEINNERKFIGDILFFDESKKEIVLKYKDNNQKEEDIVIFNLQDIQNLIAEIKNKKNKEVLESVLQKIREDDTENSNGLIIQDNAIIDNNGKAILSAEKLKQITNGQTVTIQLTENKKIDINGKDIQRDNIDSKLQNLIKQENKIENSFLEYLTKSIRYFSPYIQGEINMWTIMYFLNSADFNTTADNIEHKESSKIVLKKFIIDSDKDMYNFKELCELLKQFINSFDDGANNININNLRSKILAIHNKQKLFKDAPLDYKILCIWYDMFIIEALLAKEDKASKKVYREKIYELFSKGFIDNQSEFFHNLMSKILKKADVFSRYNSYMDILENKHFYFKRDCQSDAKDLREDGILVLDTEFNLSLMILLYRQIMEANKKINVTLISNSIDNIYSLIAYEDHTIDMKNMQDRKKKTIQEIQKELKKLFDDKKKSLEDEKDGTKKNNMNENYQSISKSVLQNAGKIPLRKNLTNSKQDGKLQQAIDSFKFTRHVRNAYVLLFYKNDRDIYEEELKELFRKNEFLDAILNHQSDKMTFFQDYSNKDKDGEFKNLTLEYEDLKKKNRTELTTEDIQKITTFEQRRAAYDYYDKLKNEGLDIDETVAIMEFLANIIAGYNINEFFDLNRLYYLIVQATNSTFYIDVVLKQLESSKYKDKGYIKNYIESIKKLNSLYLKFLFYKLNEQLIIHLDPTTLTKSIVDKIWTWTITSLGGSLAIVGGAWMTGSLPALTSLLSAAGGGALRAAGVLGSGLASIALTPKGAVVGSSLLAGTLIYQNSASIKNAFMNRVDQIGAWWENWWNGQEELKLK